MLGPAHPQTVQTVRVVAMEVAKHGSPKEALDMLHGHLGNLQSAGQGASEGVATISCDLQPVLFASDLEIPKAAITCMHAHKESPAPFMPISRTMCMRECAGPGSGFVTHVWINASLHLVSVHCLHVAADKSALQCVVLPCVTTQTSEVLSLPAGLISTRCCSLLCSKYEPGEVEETGADWRTHITHFYPP